jgi:hypothetical protein
MKQLDLNNFIGSQTVHKKYLKSTLNCFLFSALSLSLVSNKHWNIFIKKNHKKRKICLKVSLAELTLTDNIYSIFQ